MFEKLLHFIGGKPADIFAEDGTVRHKLPKQKWEAWQKRYTSSPEYNWKNHTGTKAGSSSKKNH
ncbi:MAG: hypothetical protein KDD58_09520 [Bdellovibrionales bacterium]|nr:hypothetical protein [Bdellovibrionales bacterium]